ncbi:MAG: hypothetical protein R3C68_10020 [Myxococcota bacterium]
MGARLARRGVIDNRGAVRQRWVSFFNPVRGNRLRLDLSISDDTIVRCESATPIAPSSCAASPRFVCAATRTLGYRTADLDGGPCRPLEVDVMLEFTLTLFTDEALLSTTPW